MAKGKKGSGKTYKSKGQRPNVSRKLRNMAKRARQENIPVEDMLKSDKHRERIIDKPTNEHERKLQKRYLEENRVLTEAAQLFKRYSNKGMSWALAVQAVKSEAVVQVTEKFAKKGKEASKKQASQ